MRKSREQICFWGSALGFLVVSVAIFLCYPASYMALNRESDALRITACILFWLGLLMGLVFQIICFVLRKRQQPDYKTQFKQSVSGIIKGYFARNQIVWFMIAAFIVGLLGSAVSLANSNSSNYHTFFFMALTVFGFCEYLVFNSLNFAYIMQRSENNEK